MFVNGFLKLIEAGIVRREEFADAVLQQLINEGRVPAAAVTPQTLRALLQAGRVHLPLGDADLAFLQHTGVLRPGLRRGRKALLVADGTRLLGGVFMTGGFFIGPNDFYERLRSMPPHELEKFDTTRIDFINQLYVRRPGDSDLRRALHEHDHDRHAAGRGGVGRSPRGMRKEAEPHLLMSSIVWNYGHVTTPRHLRDIVFTEYGVADLRGQGDADVVKRLDDALHPWSLASVLPAFPFGTDLTGDELQIGTAIRRLQHATQNPLELVQMTSRSLWQVKTAPATYLERLGLAEARSV